MDFLSTLYYIYALRFFVSNGTTTWNLTLYTLFKTVVLKSENRFLKYFLIFELWNAHKFTFLGDIKKYGDYLNTFFPHIHIQNTRKCNK